MARPRAPLDDAFGHNPAGPSVVAHVRRLNPMKHSVLVLVLALAACAGDNSSASSPTTSKISPDPAGEPPAPRAAAIEPEAEPGPAPEPAPAPEPEPPPLPPPDARDFLADVLPLLCRGEAGDAFVAHCERIRAIQATYRDGWLATARPFFSQHVPAGLPSTVVYPFAGGDLSTALTVFPEAAEITTLSLEPAGDPRRLATLKPKALTKALGEVEKELEFLFRVTFSNTVDIQEAMAGGALPTQLVFSLLALELHGFEPVAVYYFKLGKDGAIDYLNDADLAKLKASAHKTTYKANREFGNVEVRYRRPGARAERIYRHLQGNLDNDHLKKDRRILRHLEAKGQVAAMTKAAAYLLTWKGFTLIRDYLLDHMVWMVSDATCPLPSALTKAGFVFETYGAFKGAHMKGAGSDASREWPKVFDDQPQRDLGFRFGYPDSGRRDHLIITRKP
jgi:hypothetical protein